MKKILLSALALSAVSVFAQDCVLGYAPTAATDNFESPEDYGTEDGGVYWFGADKDGSVITFERDAENGQLDVDVTQAQSLFEPLGFGFGDSNGDGTGTPVTLDLTAGSFFEISVTNNDPTVTIQTRLAIQNVNGYLVELNTLATNAAPYTGQIAVTVAPGETQVLTGTFEGGYQGFYKDADTCISLGATPAANDDMSCIVQELDYTKVSTVLVTIINADQPATNKYEPLAIANVPVSINYVKIGADCEFPVLIKAPTEFSVTDASTTGVPAIMLDWTDNSENEDGFTIYRKLMAEADYSPLATVDADVTTYTDNTVEFDTEYLYKVAATLGENEALTEAKTVTPVGFGDDIVKLKANIYPNPATSTLSFSEELEGVVIYNSKGIVDVLCC